MENRPKPERTITDYLGNEIREGLPVAFNLSGYVRLGTIVELYRSEWKPSRYWPGWRLFFELHVKDSKTGKISKIKNPGSFFIISGVE